MLLRERRYKMPTKPKIENIYKTGKSSKPAYKITVSPKKLSHKKRADELLEDLISRNYNIRLYKDGRRMPIGSLNLTIIFPWFEWGERKNEE